MRYRLAASIRESRRRSGLSQAALAVASGTSRITIARLESGSAQDFRLGKLQRLCNALGLELAALPKGAKPADRSPPAPAPVTGESTPLRKLDARRRHAALAAAPLAVNPEDAAAMVRQPRQRRPLGAGGPAR